MIFVGFFLLVILVSLQIVFFVFAEGVYVSSLHIYSQIVSLLTQTNTDTSTFIKERLPAPNFSSNQLADCIMVS